MAFEYAALALNTEIKSAPSMKLTLVILANHMNKSTQLCNPSVATVAKQVGVSAKQARQLIKRLKHEGYISVVKNSLGGLPGNTSHYAINFVKLGSNPILKSKNKIATPLVGGSTTPPASKSPREPLKVLNDSHGVAITPPAKVSQTNSESNLTNKSLKEKYGDYWFENAALVRKLIPHLKIIAAPHENTTDIGLRIKGMLE